MGWRRHKRLLNLTKGYRGRGNNCYTIAVNRWEKGAQYAYQHRHMKRRDARQAWILSINAAARMHGLKYSQLQHGLTLANIDLNRKVLADLAISEPYSFKAVAETVKAVAPAITVTPDPVHAPKATPFDFLLDQERDTFVEEVARADAEREVRRLGKYADVRGKPVEKLKK